MDTPPCRWRRNPNGSFKRELLSEENVPNSKTKESGQVPDYVRVILVTDMNGRKRKLLIPAALDLDRPKRPRTSFSMKQLQSLETEFLENHFISEIRRQILARELGLTETQIKVWFQNRRTKLKKEKSQTKFQPPPAALTCSSPQPYMSFPDYYKSAGSHFPPPSFQAQQQSNPRFNFPRFEFPVLSPLKLF